MVGARIIEVDRLFDEAQAEHAGVERIVDPRVAADRRYMM